MNDVVADVPVDTPVTKVLSCDHCTVYGVAANPLASVDADHDHVGVVLFVGVAVVGVPGTVGGVVSTIKVFTESVLLALPAASVTLIVQFEWVA